MQNVLCLSLIRCYVVIPMERFLFMKCFLKIHGKQEFITPKSDDQTEAVYVDLYKSFDIASVCMLGTEMNAFRDSVELTQEDRMVAKKIVKTKKTITWIK